MQLPLTQVAVSATGGDPIASPYGVPNKRGDTTRYGTLFVPEHLVEDEIRWVDAMYEQESVKGDLREQALCNCEYADIYLNLGVYEKAMHLHVEYLDGLECARALDTGNTLCSYVRRYIGYGLWKESVVFLERLFAVFEICLNEDNEEWVRDQTNSLLRDILYEINTWKGNNRKLQNACGAVLDRWEDFLINHASFPFLEFELSWLPEEYAESKKSFLIKRAQALAKKLG